MIGSYFLAQEMKVKGPRRRAASRSRPRRRGRRSSSTSSAAGRDAARATLRARQRAAERGRPARGPGRARARPAPIVQRRGRGGRRPASIMSASSEPSRSSTSSPLVEGDDRGDARQVVRVLAPDRALVAVADQHDVRRGAPNSRWISRISKCAASSLLGDVARRVRRGDVEDVLADQVEHVADQRVARADVAGRDQLHGADAVVGHGQVVRDDAPPPARGTRSARARAGRPSPPPARSTAAAPGPSRRPASPARASS